MRQLGIFPKTIVRRNQREDPKPDLKEQTVAFWSNRTGREISQEDARQIIENVTGFFQVLFEWEKAEQSKARPSANIRRS
jgi:hypothetical protein